MDRLRQRADFLAAAKGLRAPGPAFVLQARARADDGPARVGFTVSKKVGNSPERNRARRRLREVVKRTASPLMRPRCDYVLIGRREALSRDFNRMCDDMASALLRLDAQLSKRLALQQPASPQPALTSKDTPL